MTTQMKVDFDAVTDEVRTRIEGHPAYDFMRYLDRFTQDAAAGMESWLNRHCPEALVAHGEEDGQPLAYVHPLQTPRHNINSKIPTSQVLKKIFNNVENGDHLSFNLTVSLLDEKRHISAAYNKKDGSFTVRFSPVSDMYVPHERGDKMFREYNTATPEGLAALDKDLKKTVGAILLRHEEHFTAEKKRKSIRRFMPFAR